MKRIRLETSRIWDWGSFHDEFSKLLGFPAFYGRNMNAWIDCMSDIGVDRMTNIEAQPGEPILLEVTDPKDFRRRCPEQFDALVECSAFVNDRFRESGGPILCLVFVIDERR